MATRLSVNGKLEYFICSKESCYNKEKGEHCRDLMLQGDQYICQKHGDIHLAEARVATDYWSVYTGRRCQQCLDSEVPK